MRPGPVRHDPLDLAVIERVESGLWHLRNDDNSHTAENARDELDCAAAGHVRHAQSILIIGVCESDWHMTPTPSSLRREFRAMRYLLATNKIPVPESV